MANKTKYVYATLTKLDPKKKNNVDEDLSYPSEDDAIKEVINTLSGRDSELKDKYENGDEIKIYLHELDSDRVPQLFKKVKVKKDGDDFEVDVDDTYDLPEDFKPYGDSSDEDGDDDIDTDESDSDEKEDKKKESKSKDKKDESEDDEPDKESDDENSEEDEKELEEACNLVDNLCELYRAGLITESAFAVEVAFLEAVVGKKSLKEAKSNMKQAHKDTRHYFKYQAHYGQNVPEKDKDMYKNNTIHDMIRKERSADARYSHVSDEYNKQRWAAKDRLMEAKKAKREKELAAKKAEAKEKLNAIKDKIKSKTAKPVAESAIELVHLMRESTFISPSLSDIFETSFIAAALMENIGIPLNDSYTMDESVSYAEYLMDQRLALTESVDTFSKFTCKPAAILMIEGYITEKTLKARDRNALNDSDFGIPELKKYPIHDKVHVRAAIQRFNYVEPKYESELAKNILKAMKKFNMLDKVEVGKDNRFSKYLTKAYNEFTNDYDIKPFPKAFTTEFSVGAMLPMMGSTAGWGTKLAETDIGDVVNKDNRELMKYATLYDTSELLHDANEYNKKVKTGTSLDSGIVTFESVLPHRNIIFDKEVEKLVKTIKEYISNPKNDFLDDILKKSLNFRKNIYTIHLRDQDGNESNKIINKIKSSGFRDVDDQGVKAIYEKEVHGLLITLVYDTVGDKLKITYEEMAPVKESVIEEATKEDIDVDIRDIIDSLNRKGYKTKYSCSGHTKTRIKEDGYRDGVYNGKLYTTARIVFDDDYDIGVPKGWKKKQFDGKMGIYPVPKSYGYSQGVPDDAFDKWKAEYMASLKSWADSVGDKPGPKE